MCGVLGLSAVLYATFSMTSNFGFRRRARAVDRVGPVEEVCVVSVGRRIDR